MNILLATANFPDSFIDVEREHRTLQGLLEKGNNHLRVLPATEAADLRQALMTDQKDGGFDILHFSGHATKEEGLYLRGRGRRKDFLDGEQLKGFLKNSGIKLVVLNACHSEALAITLSEVVPVAIGTTRVVRDVVARQFTRHFYAAIIGNSTIQDAFEAALEQQKSAYSPAYMYASENRDCTINQAISVL